MGLTLALGEFIAQSHHQGFSDEARALTKLGFIDAIGTTIAGSHDETVMILRRAYPPEVGGKASVLFGSEYSSPESAALLQGVAAHALDFDDVALRGHPSVILVSAIIPLAQELNSTGIEMMNAYLAGYETWGELVYRETDMHHMKGWHPTGVFGAVAAAAACASLRKLDSHQASNAIGIGASLSAGLMANFGSMTKPLHVGRAAQNGIIASRLASLGFTAANDALEHPQGFLAALSPSKKVDLQRPIRGMSEHLYIQEYGLNIKKYPTCYYTHRAIDAVLKLNEEHSITLDEIQGIEVLISKEHSAILRNHEPKTALEAKFSIEFAMASALIDGCVGMLQLTDSSVLRPEIQNLMKKVKVIHSNYYDPLAVGWAMYDQVKIAGKDGAVISSEPIRYAYGHEKNPIPIALIKNKFIDCLFTGGYQGNGDALFAKLSTLESISARILCH